MFFCVILCYYWYMVSVLVSRFSMRSVMEWKGNYMVRLEVIRRVERVFVRGYGLGFII